MKYIDAFTKWYMEKDKGYPITFHEVWEACEEFIHSLKCEDCKYMTGYHSGKSEFPDACNNENKCSDCFPCKYWEAAGIAKEGYERLRKEIKIEELRNLRDELLQKTVDTDYGMKNLTEEEHKQHRKAMDKFFKE